MGGRVAGGVPALLLGVLLILADAAAPAVTVGKEDGLSVSSRPATESEVRIALDWEHKDDLSFEYLLTNWPAPLEYPYDGDYVSNIGGCPGKELGGPMTPLVLPESLMSYRLEDSPYSLVVTAQGVCSSHDYFEQFAKVEEIGKTVKVWATVDYWAPGGTAPYRTAKLGPISAPIFVQESDHRPYRREFDSEIKVPSAEEALAEAAARAPRPVDDDQPAALPPLDPRLGVTEAAAPPASYDEQQPAQEDVTAESGPAYQPEQVLSEDTYIAVARLLWGIALDGRISDETRAEALSLIYLLKLLMSPDEPAQDASAIDLDAPDDTPVEAPQSALDALAGPEDDTNVAPPGVTGPDALTFVGEPPDLKAEQQKQMQNHGRVWVQLPAKVKIDTGKSKRPKHTLKTKTWYQVKLDPEGTQVFYSEKGRLIGRNLGSDPVQVRAWVPEEQEQ